MGSNICVSDANYRSIKRDVFIIRSLISLAVHIRRVYRIVLEDGLQQINTLTNAAF